jgi:hypothetical protein
MSHDGDEYTVDGLKKKPAPRKRKS